MLWRLVGCPTGRLHYGTDFLLETRQDKSRKGCEWWLCDEGELRVLFDEEDIVYNVTQVGVSPVEPPSLFSRICSYFGL